MMLRAHVGRPCLLHEALALLGDVAAEQRDADGRVVQRVRRQVGAARYSSPRHRHAL